jgi:membrane protein implicated in regulation of membrane protease activity
MESFVASLWPLTVWHWLVLGMLLIAVEMAVGTFDLLWVGTAALGTALLFSGVVPLPELLTGSGWQLGTFGALAMTLVVLGRTVFSGGRKSVASYPTLNQRDAGMVGQRGLVSQAFRTGQGRVALGDTSWLAQSEGAEDLADGSAVEIVATRGALLIVKPV